MKVIKKFLYILDPSVVLVGLFYVDRLTSNTNIMLTKLNTMKYFFI